MKKAIAIVVSFLLVSVVAIVYGIHRPPAQPPKRPITTTTTSSGNIEFEWKLNNPYLLKNGTGDVFLDLRVSGKSRTNSERKRMNVVLVIDRSGSMGDQNKLEQVKQAAVEIVNNMNPTDRLGIVIYDDTISTLYPSSSVENKSQIRNLLYSLTPGGSTNLCGGMLQGFEEVRKHFDKQSVNRIILLSDGLANVGIIEPDRIAAEAQRIREHSISVTTMGVGTDYNETLMANIADHSGGNYWYISHDVDMAGIFRSEWNLMQNLVATEAQAEFDLAEGVQVVDVPGFKWQQNGPSASVQVPDIYSGETKRILVHLRAPSNKLKKILLADARFSCVEMNGGKPKVFAQSFQPQIDVIDNPEMVRSNYDDEVQQKVSSVIAGKKMEEAYKRLEEGDAAGALEITRSNVQDLRALGYIGNESQIRRYEEFEKQLAAPMEAPARKDALKKQKAAERKSLQGDAQ